jgi:histone acetyltransferase (RNA polymerase elongator complex component)
MPANSAPAKKVLPQKPLVIPVFIPNAGCPHRCVFCNQTAVTGRASDTPSTIALRADVDRFFSHRFQPRRPVQIAFYGGNFLGLAPPLIRKLLEAASHYVDIGRVDSLRFSTRPDTITPERMALLQGFPVRTIEIGAQSMSDRVLGRSRRGHSQADTARAITLLKASGYETGIQLMVGLPGERREDVGITGWRSAALAPDLARIYPTLVLADSSLAQMYQQGRFTPIGLNEAVRRTAMLYQCFYRVGTRVIRMGLQASDDLSPSSNVLAGPYHPAFGHLVFSAFFLEAVSTAIDHRGLQETRLVLRVNPRSESKLRGLKNQNLGILKRRYQLTSFFIVADEQLPEQEIRVNGCKIDVMATGNSR